MYADDNRDRIVYSSDDGTGSSNPLNQYAWTLTHNQLSTAPPNANPYGLLPTPRGTFVADAGSNTLDFVGANGSVQLLAGDPLPAPGGFPGDGVPT